MQVRPVMRQPLDFRAMNGILVSLLMLLVVAANALIFAYRAENNVPVGESGAGNMVLRGMAKWAAPPFLLLVLGAALGWSGITTGDAYATRPFDILPFLAVLVMFMRGSVWIFREGGAKFVAERQLLNGIPSEVGVKVLWLLCVIGTTIGWLVALAIMRR
jgi:hypothetical protein